VSWNTKPDLVLMIVCAFFIAAICGYVGWATNDLMSSVISVMSLALGILFICIGRSK
jgi:TRAP-type C4-dicarboxylate transport system permease small subunit